MKKIIIMSIPIILILVGIYNTSNTITAKKTEKKEKPLKEYTEEPIETAIIDSEYFLNGVVKNEKPNNSENIEG